MQKGLQFITILAALLLSAACATSIPLKISDIENRKWRIESFFDGFTMARPEDKFADQNSVLNVAFPGNRIVEGKMGCGSLDGFYEDHDGYVRIVGAVVQRACYKGDDEMGARVGEALMGDRMIERNGQRIVLKDLDGRRRIVLVPWDADKTN